MNKKNINGLQQAGVGVPSVPDAWKWYRQNFGVDIRVFEESAQAELMLPYTGGKPHARHAALAVNLQGGGGFEIWNYTSRKPEPANFDIQLGDYGLYAIKIKCKDAQKTYDDYVARNQKVSSLVTDPKGNKHFYVLDPYGNVFQLVEGKDWFREEQKLTGGAYGAIIGVSDIEASLKVYADILEYDVTVYDETGTFDDLKFLPSGDGEFRRVLLRHSKTRTGGFSPLFGSSEIELVQAKSRTPRKIYENRFWGDLGFIHLCFDISGMDLLKAECQEKGFPFTIDSFEGQGKVFDMGEASGHFSYIEDPDGTLIEFVETLKVPIMKKFGWYLNMSKRDPLKNLPNWIIGAMRFNRVKN